MNRARFRLQAVVVLALIVLVSWPQMRPVRATSIWRAAPATEAPQTVAEDPRFQYGDEKRARIGYGSMASRETSDGGAGLRRGPRPGEGDPAPSYITPPAEAVA